MEGRYVFADGLAMNDTRDPYCLPGQDRRFQTERLYGLKPAGLYFLYWHLSSYLSELQQVHERRGNFDPMESRRKNENGIGHKMAYNVLYSTLHYCQ